MANPYLIGTLIAAIVTPEPNTKCPVCWTAEANTFHRFWRRPPNPPSLASVLQAALGSSTTWYDKHRNTYVSTGSRIELERMLRHVDTLSV